MSEATIFYLKKGSRYQPVKEYDSNLMEALPYGHHLISVNRYSKSTRYSIDPAYAPMIAAGIYGENAMCTAILDASEMRPAITPLTIEQQQAWDSLKKAYGDDMFYIMWPSAADIARAGIHALSQEAEKLLKNAAVRIAYENFMLVAKLAMSQSKADDD
jgi:hypothetical protein